MGLVVANTGVTCRLKMHSADPIVILKNAIILYAVG